MFDALPPGSIPTAALVSGFVAFLLWTRRSLLLLSLAALPGVFLHELSHFTTGLLLGAQPVGFSVWPRRHADGGYILGTVTFQNVGWLNGAPVGMAPLLLVPGAWLLLTGMAAPAFVGNQWFEWTGWSFLAANLLFAALPSGMDFRVAGKSLALYAAVAGGVFAWHLGWIR